MPSKRVSLKGKGADLFFGDYAPPVPPGADSRDLADLAGAAPLAGSPPDEVTATEAPDQPISATAESAETAAPDRPSSRPRRATPRDSRARNGASERAGELARTRASTISSEPDGTIEAIRKVVKVPGREVSYVRLTAEEKARLGDLVFTFKRQGQKTTENEINRIALNYLLHDFQEHGERSVLARVLAALLA